MQPPGPLPGSLDTGSGTAVAPVTGHRPNEVLWWHHCPSEGRWTAGWLTGLQLTGLAADGDLTVHGLIECLDGCGKRGHLRDMTWTDA